MKEIKLTKGLVAYVDDCMFDELNKFKWYARKGKNTFYAARNKRGGRKVRDTIHMHREVLMPPKGMIIDHKDDNGLNNQISNLRICTTQQNISNKKPKNSCSSIYKGVHWIEPNKKWRAGIMFNYKHIYLGCFSSEIEAAKQYDSKAIELFGEFAKLNFKAESSAKPF